MDKELNAGYDQPSDPPSYNQAVVDPYGKVPPTAPAPAPTAIQHVTVSQQPQQVHHSNTVVMSSPAVVVYPQSYLAWSIFTCLCCFWPLGIVAIIFSVMSRDSAFTGDLVGARSKATVAMILNIVSMVLGIVILTIVIVVKATINTYDDY